MREREGKGFWWEGVGNGFDEGLISWIDYCYSHSAHFFLLPFPSLL